MRDVTQNSKSHSKWGVEDQAGRSRFPILHVYVAPPCLRKRPPSQLLRFPVSFLQPPISKKNRKGHAVYGFDTSLFSRSVKKQANKKRKLKMGIYLVALCFDSQWRKLKTNKRTKKQTVSKTHLWGSKCCPGSSGYSLFFREMFLLCTFLQSVQIGSNSHLDDFCQIDTGFVISRQEKSTLGMLKLGWDTEIETKSRLGEGDL